MQQIKIEPSMNYVDFNFKAGKNIRSVLRLINDGEQNNETAIFKIKTTNPQQFIVKPSLGYIKAGETKQIDIILQPQQQIYVSKDKFQILTASVDQILQDENQHFNKIEKAKLTQHQLKVRFISSENQENYQENNNNNNINNNNNNNIQDTVTQLQLSQTPQRQFQSVIQLQDQTDLKLYQSHYISQQQETQDIDRLPDQQIIIDNNEESDIKYLCQIMQEKILVKTKQIEQASEDRNKLQKEYNSIQSHVKNNNISKGYSIIFVLIFLILGNLSATFLHSIH